MPADTPLSSEDRIFGLLCKTGLTPEEANTLYERICEMASTNRNARFESKMDAQLQAIQSELTMRRWLMVLGFSALVAAAIAQLFCG